MRVADYIFKYLKDQGVDCVFLVVGGAAMHLNDALKKSGLKYYCFHHEQGATIAAEGYSRVSSKMGVICVTSGPGGTNALTGILGAWTDSVPILCLSGQVKLETCMANYPDLKLRQLGDQECDIVSIVKSITKYAKLIMKPEEVREELKKAVEMAISDRPGPVWLDIPLDIQKAEI